MQNKFRLPSAKPRSLLAAAALFGLAAIVPTSAQATLFTNGDFELSPLGNANFHTLGTGSTAITGWQVAGGGIDYIVNYWQDASGQRSIDLSATSAGQIFQTFDTLAGATYQVTFAMAGNPADKSGAEAIKTLQATAANYTGLFDFTHTANHSLTNMGWVDMTFLFTATTNQTTLRFTSLESSAYGPALDNVRVAVIPEPGSLALLGLGLAGLGALRRRKAG